MHVSATESLIYDIYVIYDIYDTVRSMICHQRKQYNVRQVICRICTLCLVRTHQQKRHFYCSVGVTNLSHLEQKLAKALKLVGDFLLGKEVTRGMQGTLWYSEMGQTRMNHRPINEVQLTPQDCEAALDMCCNTSLFDSSSVCIGRAQTWEQMRGSPSRSIPHVAIRDFTGGEHAEPMANQIPAQTTWCTPVQHKWVPW